MTDYSDLVRKMRTCIGDKKCFEKECRYWSELGCMDGNICCDAADAIEALQAEQKKTVTHIFCEEQQKWEEYCTGLMSRIRELKAQMPKRGEWIDDEFTSKGRCSVCGEEWSWFDNCMETFKYCPNCGAKMEVQDGQA